MQFTGNDWINTNVYLEILTKLTQGPLEHNQYIKLKVNDHQHKSPLELLMFNPYQNQ